MLHDFDPHLAVPAPARVKVLHPILTDGPSTKGEILAISGNLLRVRVPGVIVVGSTVQVRSGEQLGVGTVRTSASGEIEIAI